eukprot:TRINITY_DN3466_c0_g1_i1.p1 TRINITY_DN3466_c0_g1~~TRINITY_DN3466_c0_g1_i1.p1  ORF type:complete len:404 (-),score=46.15 TRINITY_DN3466_c0_g1_i1:34-1245(-)
MKITITLLVIICISLSVLNVSCSEEYIHWVSFKSNFNKTYSSQEEETYRQEIFTKNLQWIRKFNEQHGQTILGVTKFTDIEESSPDLYIPSSRGVSHTAPQETTNSSTTVPSPSPSSPSSPSSSSSSPSPSLGGLRGSHGLGVVSCDWRAGGFVSPVRDQDACGACVAFSALAVLESAWLKKGYSPAEFSPQDIIDCCSSCGGCSGTDFSSVFPHLSDKGISKTSAYSYRGDEGKCHWVDRIAKAQNYETQLSLSQALEFLNTTSPFVSAIDASALAFRNYKPSDPNYIIDDTICGTRQQVDHAVTVIGYGYDGSSHSNGGLYFIIKNSWGTEWGSNGFFNAYYDSCRLNSHFYAASDVIKYRSDFWTIIIVICVVSSVFLLLAVSLTICVIRRRKKTRVLSV